MTIKPSKSTKHNADNRPISSSRRNLLAGMAGFGMASAAIPAVSPAAEANHDQSLEVADGHVSIREFEGRSAFITGGSRGIGYATAEVLAKAGANIVLYDVAQQIEHVKYPLATFEDLATAKANIEALGVQCLAIQGDVRDGAKLKQSMNQTVTAFGRLDMVIVNAGITQTGALEDFSEAEVDVVLDVNLAGAIKTVQAAIPILRQQNSGRIVLMSSITGRAGSDRFPIYCASKWGMIGLAKSTALILGKSNVTCNAVCPSLVHTKLLDNEYVLSALIPDNPTFEAFNAGAQQRHILPVGLYDPVHVANTVKFLCSDAAALTSGDVFDISAGINAQFNA